VRLNLPAEGCCFNYVQAGMVVHDSDDAYVKLVHASIWETRQTEFAKEVAPVEGLPRYGNTVVGPPGEWTWLRIAKTTVDGEEHYRAYTSDDGVTWVRGGVWTHELGSDARIGLVSMGGSGFTAEFDYVRVYRPDGWNGRGR
jgi:arabinan endo-1,5-alpha-L-arabinosidase